MEFLTAMVTPNEGVERSEERYLLVWRIMPEVRAAR